MIDDSELRRCLVLSGVPKILRSAAVGRGLMLRSFDLSSSRGRDGMGPDLGGTGGAVRGALPGICQILVGA